MIKQLKEKKLRIAILGLGSIGRKHLRIIRRLQNQKIEIHVLKRTKSKVPEIENKLIDKIITDAKEIANNKYDHIIISSPSGAGKSSLARELVDSDPNLSFSISFTTREKRRGELDGKDSFFVDISTFKNLSEKGDMLEYAKVFGNYYGTPKAPIELGLMEGKDFVFDVDWQGGDQIRSSDFSENVISIFILPPSISELENRLLGRRQDSKEIVSNRMAEAKSEIEHWKEYDYVLVNNELEINYR